MQDYELQVGDLAHCDEAKGIDRPFIGKVVRCEGQTYDMEVVYIPDLTHANASLLHTQVQVVKTASAPFANKADVPFM